MEAARAEVEDAVRASPATQRKRTLSDRFSPQASGLRLRGRCMDAPSVLHFLPGSASQRQRNQPHPPPSRRSATVLVVGSVAAARESRIVLGVGAGAYLPAILGPNVASSAALPRRP
jgi:hypothetical protein